MFQVSQQPTPICMCVWVTCLWKSVSLPFQSFEILFLNFEFNNFQMFFFQLIKCTKHEFQSIRTLSACIRLNARMWLIFNCWSPNSIFANHYKLQFIFKSWIYFWHATCEKNEYRSLSLDNCFVSQIGMQYLIAIDMAGITTFPSVLWSKQHEYLHEISTAKRLNAHKIQVYKCPNWKGEKWQS